MKSWLEFALMAISLGSACFGVISWYSAAVKKSYASQRDFEHLKRNYEQLAANQAAILKEMDSRFDQQILELKDLKALQLAMITKLSGEQSTGWVRKREE